MLIKSSVIAGASGSLGGLTASHNRGGQYLRARVIPTNPNSTYQQTIRTWVAWLSSHWSELTDVQQGGWTTYADNVPVLNALGDPIYLTGLQWYVKANVARLQAGLARVDVPPAIFTMVSLAPVSATPTAGTNKLNVSFSTADDWVDTDDAALLVYASQGYSKGVNFFKGPYRYAGKIDGDSVTPPTSPESTLVGPILWQGDCNVFVRALCVLPDGRISADQKLGPFYVAGV